MPTLSKPDDTRTRADIEKESRYWFDMAEDYLKSARILYAHNGPTRNAAGHLNRAMSHYLRGCLASKGIKINRIRSLNTLFRLAAETDRRFVKFLKFGFELHGLKMESNYPGKAKEEPSREKMRAMIETGDRLIALLKGESNG